MAAIILLHTGMPDAILGQLPILEINGTVLLQSMAIGRYLSREFSEFNSFLCSSEGFCHYLLSPLCCVVGRKKGEGGQ